MTPATTVDLTALHDRVARYVHAHFRRKLTFEDARDVAADALLEADRAAADGEEIAELERWLRRAAWRNALDLVRRHEGESASGPRPRPADLADHADVLATGERLEDELIASSARRAEAVALASVWSALKPDEQRALRLRLHDELAVPDICAILSCSRHHYENLVKRATRKLRQALVDDDTGVGCRDTRLIILRGTATVLDGALLARRDAHLSGCLACRAFACRARGLLGLMPMPAAGAADRLISRLNAILAGKPDALPETLGGLTVAGAGAGGAVGATSSGAAGGMAVVVKTLAAVCSAGAVTAGVCLPSPHTHHDPARASTPTPAHAARNPATASASATTIAARAVTSTPVRSPVAAARNSRSARQERSADKTFPFTPESAADAHHEADSRPSITDYGTPVSDPAPAAKAASTSRTPSVAPQPAPGAASNFSTEFGP
jgi:RNA polymerase sigma factor (sigma-70 family)